VTFGMVAAVVGIGLAVVLGVALLSGDEEIPVILISIDTCRADHLGCYNPARTLTPNIDAFAAGATRFTRVVAPIPLTLPSHTSMLTGHIPPVHGAYGNGSRVPDANLTLAEILSADGYRAAAVVSSAVLARQFNLAQGFEHYDDYFSSCTTTTRTRRISLHRPTRDDSTARTRGKSPSPTRRSAPS
jgi:arylsulfatase A-like enzyme